MTTTTKKTWRELEAEGVKRCGMYFVDGTRCRRRAATTVPGPSGGSWCAKHGAVIKMHEDHFKQACKQMEKEQHDD